MLEWMRLRARGSQRAARAPRRRIRCSCCGGRRHDHATNCCRWRSGSSLLPGSIIFALPETRIGLRTFLNLFAAIAKLGLVALLLAGVAAGEDYGVRYAVLPGLELALKADALGMLFITLSAILWLFTTLYAIGYLEGAPHRSRFFGFFSLCVTATMGIAMAGEFVHLFHLLRTADPVHLPAGRASRHGQGDEGRHDLSCLHADRRHGIAAPGIVWLHHLLGHTEFAHAGILPRSARNTPAS